MQGSGRVQCLGGRLLHRLDFPGAEPAVLLLGGCGVPSFRWLPVVDGLQGRRVVALDRPGLVDTPWPGRLPALHEEVGSLVELLEELDPPAVVVGHSMGGIHAEAVTRMRPDLVGGLVLVDTSVDLDPAAPRPRPVWARLAHLSRRAAERQTLKGLASWGERIVSAVHSKRLPWYDRRPREQADLFRRPDTIASVLAEQAAERAQLWELARLRERYPWPDLPAAVLTATGDRSPRWLSRQAELAELLRARHVAVQDSRHLMMIDRPDIIADVVSAVVTGR